MRVLVLNAGSSTLKASLVLAGSSDEVTESAIEWAPGQDERVADVVEAALEAFAGQPFDAVGHRVVHGGERFGAPALVDDTLIAEVLRLDALAPLHNRRAAAVMQAARARLGDTPHVACFDTSFHATLPEAAWRYPLPADWTDRWGLRRFGFHGLSVAWATRRAAELLERDARDLRLVVAHLGSGASVTAVDGGRSVETSMGFTPYEGIMMGTRSGSIDPGILLRLTQDGMDAEALADGLAHRSGLLAIAGTADMREIDAGVAAGDSRARLAHEMFARRAAAGIAGACVAIPSVDALVFTGGIGEHSGATRQAIVDRLGPLGLPANLDAVANDGVLSPGSPAVVVVRAREDLVIAGEAAQLLRA